MLLRLVSSLAAAVAFLVLAVPSVVAADTVTWGVRTADTEEGESRDNYSYTLEPGSVVHDAMVVTNHSTSTLALDLSAADGFTSEEGELDVAPRGEKASAVGLWVVLEPGSLSLEPGASQEVAFTLTVPADATPGDYAGAVLTSLASTRASGGVDVDRRLGISIRLRVLGELVPSLAITGLDIDYTPDPISVFSGTSTVVYTVRNIGNVRLAAGQALTVSGPFGWFSRDATAIAAIPSLLPGEEWPVTVTVAGVVPAVWLTAHLEVNPRLAEDDTDLTVAPLRAEVSGWAVPWGAALAVVLVLIAGVGVLLLVRYRRRSRARAEQQRIDAAVAEALRERDDADKT